MAVLPGPDEDGKNARTEDLVAAIERRHDELGLASPWSIAELRLDDEDYIRLCQWGASLDSRTVRRWTKDHWTWADPPVRQGRPRLACLGLLLIALAAETARREATEKTLWRYVRRTPDQRPRFGEADSELFIQGQPSETFKAAIEVAVETFGLRHAIDAPDTSKRYYLTVFLQFGFTIRDAESRLPAWLVGQTLQVAMQDLAMRGGRLSSAPFAELWRDMRHYRDGLLTPKAMRERFRTSPWVLPAWCQPLLALVGQVRPSRGADGEQGQHGSLKTLLGPPHLAWPSGGTPHFTCRIDMLATASLPGRTYTIRIGGREFARIERGESGFEANREAVTIPGFPAALAIELRDEESAASESLLCECFDPRDPVLLFDLRSGRPVEARARLDAAGRYALVFADDLSLSPEPDEWRAVRCGPLTLRVAAITGDIDRARLLTRDATIVWEARTGSNVPAAPAWAQADLEIVTRLVSLPSVPLCESYEVAIRHRDRVRVTFVRRGMEPLDLRPIRPGLTHVGPIQTAVPSLGRASTWLIGLEQQGELARVKCEFQPPQHGGAVFRGDAWEILDPRNTLDADDLRRSPVLILCPPVWDSREINEGGGAWAVMEGEDWVDAPGSRPRIMRRLSGLGAPLTVRLGPFNAVPAVPPEGGPKRLDALILADRIVDLGLVRGVVRDDETGDAISWRIELSQVLEIDGRFEVHWWDRSGEVYHARPSAWANGEMVRHDWWSFKPPAVATEPRAVFVTYVNDRLGAWWTPRWATGLAELAEAGDPALIAYVIRWAQLPVLEEQSLSEIRRLAERWPVQVLESWISEESPDGWRFAIRAAFHDWRPRPEQLEALARALGVTDRIPQAATALRLMDICPVLMGRYLRAVANESGLADMRALFRLLRDKVALDLEFETGDYVGTEDSVYDGIQRVTRLDSAFLRNLNAVGVAAVLGLPTTDDEFDQRRNLDLAASHFTACRLLLALDIIESLEAGEPSHWKGGPCGSPRRLEADRFVAPQAR